MIIDPDDKAALAKGEKLFAQNVGFVAGADKVSILPPPTLPEVAFAGRSNVGKSSLINALTNRKALARVSHTPGRTQQLNFFELGDRLRLVDLPGYGYAAVSKKMKAGWQDLIHHYLRGRVTLRRVCVLVDSRHGMKETDREILKVLDDAAVPVHVVLTKCDEPSRAELEQTIAQVTEALKNHACAFPVISCTSSRSGAGISELRASIATLAID
jgi:GTP-binding protein